MARREAHKLAGSLGSFGFPKGSHLASEMERKFAGPPSPDEGLELSQLLADLRRALEDTPVAEEIPLGEEPTPVVFYVGPDDVRWDRLQQLRQATLVRQSLDSFPWDRVPDLLILASIEPDHLEVARHLASSQVPVAAFAGHSLSLEQRVTALRAGVLSLFESEMSRPQLLRAVSQLLPGAGGRPMVLALDDNPMFLRVLERLLRGQGVQLETVATVEQFWSSLQQRRPDVVLLDLEMPDFSGQELCLTLRAQPATEDLPIFIVSATDDPEIWENLYAAGADDCLAKPVRSRELIFRIRNRLQRAQAIRNHSLVESETGLLRRRYARESLIRMMGLSDRVGVASTVAVIATSGARAEVDGALRLLSRAIGPEDSLGRLGPDSVVLGLFQQESGQALDRVRQLLAPHQGADLVLWAGLAEYPRDGLSVDLLCERARASAEVARSQNLVVIGYGLDANRSAAETLDVIMIEDDSLLAPVVMQALEQKGLSCRWFERGTPALEVLSGIQPALRPRVVLLDWDLPDISGLEILARLRDDGSLQRTRVILFTVRSNEADILRALALGAYDHVTKPSSLQVLMERIRLALRN